MSTSFVTTPAPKVRTMSCRSSMEKMINLLYLFCLVKGSLNVMGVATDRGSGRTNVALSHAMVSWSSLVDKTSASDRIAATGHESSLSSAGVDMNLGLMVRCGDENAQGGDMRHNIMNSLRTPS